MRWIDDLTYFLTNMSFTSHLPRIALATLSVSLAIGAVSQVLAQGPRDRSEKKAVRGMTGEFEGLGMVLWVTKDDARRLLPSADLRLDYPDDAERHPIVLLLGAEHDVGVQLRRSYVHPRYLRQYENAYVIVPYLRHPAAPGLVYTFSKIFVSDDRVTAKGAKLNQSPKVHAAIEDGADRFAVSYEGRRMVDLAMQLTPPEEKLPTFVAISTAPHAGPSTADMLRTIFHQPKIEFSPNVHLFSLDFMADASGLTAATVSGTVRAPAIAGGLRTSESSDPKSSDVLLLAPDRPVQAVRFSSHWEKTLQF